MNLVIVWENGDKQKIKDVEIDSLCESIMNWHSWVYYRMNDDNEWIHAVNLSKAREVWVEK